MSQNVLRSSASPLCLKLFSCRKFFKKMIILARKKIIFDNPCCGKARLSKINKADILKMSANPSGGKLANGHGSDLDQSGMSESETEPDVSRSFNQTGDVSLRAYEGDISVGTNLDSTNFSSDADSPVSKNLPRGVLMQRGKSNCNTRRPATIGIFPASNFVENAL